MLPSPVILQEFVNFYFPQSIPGVRVKSLTELRKLRDKLKIPSPVLYLGSRGVLKRVNNIIYMLTPSVIYYCFHSDRQLKEELKTNNYSDIRKDNIIPPED